MKLQLDLMEQYQLGIEIGFELGFKIGYEKGRFEERLSMAKQLLDSLPVEKIAEITKLSPQEILA